jgi:hypothetical protein
MPHDEKIKFWAMNLDDSMRTDQQTADYDPYRSYSEVWLRQTLQYEPDFIKFLPEIYARWIPVWDKNEVNRRIMTAYKKLQETKY